VFGPDLANLWRDDGLHRVLAGTEVRIEPADGGVAIEPGDPTLSEHVHRYLGAGFDLDAFAGFAAEDSVLGPLVQRLRGFRPPLVPDPFESLVTSITAQQISLRAAFSIRNRFIETFGERRGAAYAFPTRERLATADAGAVAAVGLTRRKAAAVVAIARAEIDLSSLARLPDEEVKTTLVTLPGVGEWTADWFLARHLGRPAAWPAGDLGLRKALLHFYSVAETRAFGARFSRFANLAAHYLLLGLRMAG
jgi:3-methyladenine DNA glycosylase/8-oxoguanine DNA glycosylase